MSPSRCNASLPHLLGLTLALTAGCGPAPPPVAHPGPCEVSATGRDGVARLVETATYEGTRPLERRTYWPDGSLRRSWQWSYTDRGSTLDSVEHDGHSPIRFTRRRWTDPAGRWILETVDDGSDGDVDAWHTREFRGDWLARESHYRGGARLYTIGFAVREDTIEELVAWEDGGTDLTIRSHDGAGRVTDTRTDLGVDGIWDRREHTLWDLRGRVSWWEDYDADGRPELVGWREHDRGGHAELEDLDQDEIADRISRFDSVGNLQEQEFPHDEVTLRYSYACF